MGLQFRRAIEHMEIWSASLDGFSFVITHENPAGHGFHGKLGYVGIVAFTSSEPWRDQDRWLTFQNARRS